MKQLGSCKECLRVVERAGACCIIKTSSAPGQLFRTQDCRNESPMNGFLCATITAALSEEGMVRGACSCCGTGNIECMSVYVCDGQREGEKVH